MLSDLATLDPNETAWLFPGQGSQQPIMLEPFRDSAKFAKYFETICELLGRDPLEEARSAPEQLNQNRASSLLTVLASVLCLEHLQEKLDAVPRAVAGYSVGQWTALFAAGAISADQLFRIVHRRALLMDACVAAQPPSGMLAVIGIVEANLRDVCESLARQEIPVEITNENAPGQFTLGGSQAALQIAEQRLREMRPKRLVRIPVAGAWHSSLLKPIVPQLVEVIEAEELRPPRIPVVDNTTGDWLPDDPVLLRTALAEQVAAPVRWSRGIKTMIDIGVRNFVEVGYGDLLTKFGFFIDRSVRHLALVPSPRPSA